MFETLKENLEQKGYQVRCFGTKEEAADYLCAGLQGKHVGFGGSMTLLDMGIYERLEKTGPVSWHWKTPGVLPQARTAEVYLTSVNGIAETGEIVNIDGTGNRVAAMTFGHQKVYFVVGANKVAADLPAALERARNVAAPLNAKRLSRKTPCAERGDKCYDCKSPERICRALSVFWEKPGGCDYEVVLVEENLGY